jgi:hypothetical protein
VFDVQFFKYIIKKQGVYKMMGMDRTKKEIVITVMAIFFLCLFISGCSSIFSKKGSSSQATKLKSPNSLGGFPDVLIPDGFKTDKDSTYIVESSGLVTGILVLKGRVERNSLISFFQTQMVKDGWKAITSFISPQTSTFLLFQKADKWCVISIKESKFTTRMEIAVAPSGNSGYNENSGLFK